MEKILLTIKSHIGLVVSSVVAVAAAAVFIVIALTKTQYRTIQIYEMEGTATIEREGAGMIEATENLYLESGDRVTVPDGSTMRLKLDDDKYVMVEENSELTIVAEGTKEDSLTSIKLEKGAITNEIRKMLSEKSSYEVTTPNAVMAVRGTVFRVAVWVDENGVLYTRVDTFEGLVTVNRILPDGTIQEEDAQILAGNDVIIYMDDKVTEYLTQSEKIKYEDLPLPVLTFLKDCIESGRELVGITEEELIVLIEDKETPLAAGTSSDEEGTGDAETSNTSEGLGESDSEPGSDSDSDTDGDDGETTGQSAAQNDGRGSGQAGNADQTQDADLAQQIPVEDLTVAEPEQEVQQEEQQTTTQTQSSSSSSSSGSSSSSSSDSNDDSSSEDTSSDDSTYTVTFLRGRDGSETFCTKTVTAGGTVSKPKLQPTASGDWVVSSEENEFAPFNFSQAITEDTTVTWQPEN